MNLSTAALSICRKRTTQFRARNCLTLWYMNWVLTPVRWNALNLCTAIFARRYVWMANIHVHLICVMEYGKDAQHHHSCSPCFMDWLEAFLERAVMVNLTTAEKMSIRIARVLVPTLLFVDDYIFTSSQREVLQHTLDALCTFCEANCLTVSA